MKVNPVGKKFSVAERAYLAGFLDADGCIMATIEPHQEKRFGFRIRLTFKISQSNPEILNWLHRKSGIGVVRKNRTTHDWLTRDQTIVREILKMIQPYVRVKRRQLVYALQIIDSVISTKTDLLQVARLADALSRLNVRSKNRRKNHVSMIQEYFSRND